MSRFGPTLVASMAVFALCSCAVRNDPGEVASPVPTTAVLTAESVALTTGPTMAPPTTVSTEPPTPPELVEIFASAIRASCEANCLLSRPVHVITPAIVGVDRTEVAALIRRDSGYLAQAVELLGREHLFSTETPNVADGGTIVTIKTSAVRTEGVYAIDVSAVRSRYELVIETFLFQRDSDRTWELVSPEAVGVTVTSTVS